MKDFDVAMLEIVWKNLDHEKIRSKDIDTKAIGIMTITGVLMTFLPKPVNSVRISFILFALTALSFLVTILLCVLVIRTRIGSLLSTEHLLRILADQDSERQIGGLIGTIARMEIDIQKVCNDKVEDLRYAVYALGTSIVLLILYSLSTFL